MIVLLNHLKYCLYFSCYFCLWMGTNWSTSWHDDSILFLFLSVYDEFQTRARHMCAYAGAEHANLFAEAAVPGLQCGRVRGADCAVGADRPRAEHLHAQPPARGLLRIPRRRVGVRCCWVPRVWRPPLPHAAKVRLTSHPALQSFQQAHPQHHGLYHKQLWHLHSHHDALQMAWLVYIPTKYSGIAVRHGKFLGYAADIVDLVLFTVLDHMG